MNSNFEANADFGEAAPVDFAEDDEVSGAAAKATGKARPHRTQNFAQSGWFVPQ